MDRPEKSEERLTGSISEAEITHVRAPAAQPLVFGTVVVLHTWLEERLSQKQAWISRCHAGGARLCQS